MKALYLIMTLTSVLCLMADIPTVVSIAEFLTWLLWEVVWFAVLLHCAGKMMEEKK